MEASCGVPSSPTTYLANSKKFGIPARVGNACPAQEHDVPLVACFKQFVWNVQSVWKETHLSLQISVKIKMKEGEFRGSKRYR